MRRYEPHPLSTQQLIERAATATNEPDHHHVEAAYRAARAVTLLTDDDSIAGWTETDYDHAANVAALEMALASAACLARRLYDNGPERIYDHLHRLLAHHVRGYEAVMDDLERHAELSPAHLPNNLA